MKSLCASNDIIKKVKTQPTKWKKMFTNHIWKRACCGLNVVFSRNLYVEAVIPSVMVFAVGCLLALVLDEVMRVRPPPMMGLVPLSEEEESRALSLLHVRLQKENSHQQIRKRALTRRQLCWCLDFGHPSLQNCEK